MKTIISIFLLLLIILVSCKKDDSTVSGPPPQNDTIFPPEYDTIFPLPYFPAYPGSYWTYVDSKYDTTTIITDSLYRLDFYRITGAAYISDTFYVPIYNDIPIWGYEAHTGPISHSGSYPLTQILSDTMPVGSEWVIHYWSGIEISRKILAKDTTIIISGMEYSPTIVVEEYYSYGPPNYVWIAKRYYTERIGLIREDINQDTTINTKLLIDYLINN